MLLNYLNLFPFSCLVWGLQRFGMICLSYKTWPTAKDFIQVEIVVEKNSQKIILVRKDGKALKILATAVRLDMENFLQKKVYLEVEVKVKENWRQDEGLLKYYDYGGQIKTL